MARRGQTIFTAEQDEKLKFLTSMKEIPALAREWGIGEPQVHRRRTYLRRLAAENGTPLPYIKREYKNTSAIFTSEEDEQILSFRTLGHNSLIDLAKKLDKSYTEVQHRRKFLLQARKRAVQRRSPRQKYNKIREQKLEDSKPKIRVSPFARPAWFDENLNSLTLGAFDIRQKEKVAAPSS